MSVGICGGGPVGLLLGNFLQKYKIQFKIFEKYKTLRGYLKRTSICSYY